MSLWRKRQINNEVQKAANKPSPPVSNVILRVKYDS